jgi:PAS domain S-box-containing protein
MNVRRPSVAVVVVAALVGVATLLMVVAGVVNYAWYRADGGRALRRDLATEADQLAVGLALPVWNIDRAQIDRVLAAAEADRSVFAVRLQAAAKTHTRVRDGEWRLPAATADFPTEGLLEERRDVTFDGETIGSLRIYGTTRFLDEDLGRMRETIVIRIVAFDALLVLSLYFLLRRAVVKPLTDIERFATAVRVEDGTHPAAIALSPGAARELASLRDSIEAMVRLLDTRYEAVRASEERYRLLFEGNPVPMLVYDLEWLTFLAANRAAVKQYGYAREELLQRHVSDLALPEDPHLAEFLATRFDPRPEVVEIGRRQQRRRDGSVLDVDMTSMEIVFEGRRARLLLCRDLTAENLGRQEQERLQESLRRSESMAAMGGLVAGVAHEVRNPLFSISATVDALEVDLRDRPEFMDLARLLRSQVVRLTQLTRDLLDYGKPAALSLAAVQPGDPVRVAVRACTPLARTKEVELAVRVAPGLPALTLDVTRMEQVLENLLGNAVHHSPRGTAVHLTVELTEGEGAVAFRVEDEGSGIAPADLERLFEPFFTRRDGGTGLGLPIVHRIVDAHGGVVRAANRPTGGAVFTVTLPVPSDRAEPAVEHGDKARGT